MTKIIGISGSLRKGSFNSALLRAAVQLAPPSASIEIASIREIPLYDGDVEQSGLPEPVRGLKERLVSSDGLLIVSPEYNNGIPGVLKNTIDWLSRPASDIPRVFGDRPVAVMGASTSRFGTLLAQTAWLPVLRTLGTQMWAGKRLALSGATKAFDAEGRLIDESLQKLVKEFMEGFVDFVQKKRPV